MSVAALLDSRLLLVSGKGGTGKTTYAAALAALSAARGKRTLLAEIDISRPNTLTIFGRNAGFEPVQIAGDLYLSNLLWEDALHDYLKQVVPVGRVLKLILENRVVHRFIDFTPGARELVLLSSIVGMTEHFDRVIVDMPASGHFFGMMDITRSAMGLFRSGPVRERSEALRRYLGGPLTRSVLVALPEEMVVNETLETIERLAKADVLRKQPVVFLNRATLPSLVDDERELISRLSGAADLTEAQREFVRSGRWEDRLEQATAQAQERLTEQLAEPPVLVPPVGAGHVARDVVVDVAVHLGRHVGVTRRELQWI